MRKSLFVLFLALTACSSAVRQQPGYPVELTDVAETERFPLEAAGHDRGRVYLYGPENRNYSVGYESSSLVFTHAATLFFYRTPASLHNQYRAEKEGIERTHDGAELISETRGTLIQDEHNLPFREAVYRYEEIFARRVQTVYSKLLLVGENGQYFKARSTAPWARQAEAQAALQSLLQAVRWSYCYQEDLAADAACGATR